MIWQPRDELRLVVLREHGDSLTAMARQLGISRSAVSGKLWRMGVEKREPPPGLRKWAKRGTSLPVARIRKLRAAGKSYRTIGAIVGCHASYARRLCL